MLFLFFLCVLLSCIELGAQNQFSSIQGKVTDAESLPIPGVAVTATSVVMSGRDATVYTDATGFYRFSYLAPGQYRITTALQGFQSTEPRSVRLVLGITLTVDFQLQLEAHSERLEIEGEPTILDITTPAVSFAVTQEFIDYLPNTRDIRMLITLAPGIGDDLVAYGGANEEANGTWVDGVDVSDPRRGGLFAEYDPNWIQEVQVSGIGSSAEYGAFSGAIGSYITRSGTDEFHGLMETFFSIEDLVSNNTPDENAFSDFSNLNFSAQLGGPILREKLWFFAGVSYLEERNQPFGYDGSVGYTYPKVLGKLTFRGNDNNTIQGFLHFNDFYNEGADAAPNVLPEASLDEECGEQSWNATWISLLSPQTSLETRFGGFRSNCSVNQQNGDIPGHRDYPSDIYSVNAIYNQKYDRLRRQLNVTASHHASNFIKGGHDFKFGIEWERSNVGQELRYNQGVYYFDYYEQPYYRFFFEGYNISDTNQRVSVYAQDQWRLTDRFTLSAGVRWDNNRGIIDTGTAFKTNPVAPRLGFVWALNATGKTVVKAHYGDYYDALRENQFTWLRQDSYPPIFAEIYNSGTGEWKPAWVYPAIHSTLDPDIKQPFFREVTAGLDQQLWRDWTLGAHYIDRRYKNILEDINVTAVWDPLPYINPITGEPMTIYSLVDPGDGSRFITNPDGLFRTYRAFELFVNGRLSQNFQLSGSVVYSETRGNAPNSGAFSSFLDNPNSTINYEGHLANDPSLEVKVSGIYNLPWGFRVGGFFRHQKGDTMTLLFYVPRSVAHTEGPIFGMPRGSTRLESSYLLDLRVDKSFEILSGQLHFTADIFNLFNSSYVLSINTRYNTPGFNQPDGFVAPRQVRLGVRYTF